MFKIGILSQTSAPVPPPPLVADWSDIQGSDSSALYTYSYQQVTPAPASGKLTIQYNDALTRLYIFVSPTNFLSGASGTSPSSILIDGVTNMTYVPPGTQISVNDLDYVTFGVEIFSQAGPSQSSVTIITVYDDLTFIDSFLTTVNSITSDVTPATVNWSNITFDPTTNPTITRQYTTQQITGINTPIQISISSSSAEVSTLWYRVSPLAPPAFSASLVLFDNNAEGFVRWIPGSTFTVGNGEYVTFTADGPSLGLSTTVFEIYNASDNNALLDSFTATTLSKTNFSGVDWTSVSAEFPAYTGQGIKKTFTSQTIPANQLGTSGASITVKNTNVSNANIYYSTTAVGPFDQFLDVATDPDWALIPFGATGSTFTIFTGTTVSFTVVPAVNTVTSGQFYIYNNSIGGTLVDTVEVSLIQGPDYTPDTVSWGNYTIAPSSNLWIYTNSVQITGINQPISLTFSAFNSSASAFSGITLFVWYAITATPLVSGVDYNPNVQATLNSPPFVQWSGTPITVTNGQYLTWYWGWNSYPSVGSTPQTFSVSILNASQNNNSLTTSTTTFLVPTSINLSPYTSINQDQVVSGYLTPVWTYNTNQIVGSAGLSTTIQVKYTAPSYVQLYYRLNATSTLPTSATNPTAASPAFIAINDGATILATVGEHLQFAVSYTSTTGQPISYLGYNVTLFNLGDVGSPSLGTFNIKVFPDGLTSITVVTGANRLTILGYPNELGVGVTGYKRTATVFNISSSLTTYNYPPVLTLATSYAAPAELNLYYRFYTGTTPSPAFDPFLDPATVPYYTLLQPGSASWSFSTGVFTVINNIPLPFATSAQIGGSGLLRLEIVPSATSNPPAAVTATPINFTMNINCPRPTSSTGSSNIGTTGTNSLTDGTPNALDFNNIIIGNQADGKYGFTQALQIKDINVIALFSITSYTSSAGFTVFVKYSLTPFTISNTTHPGNQGFVRIAAQNLTATSSMITPNTTYPAFTYPSNTPVTTNVTNGMYIAIAIVQDVALGGSTTLTINNENLVAVIDTFSVTWNASFTGSDPNPGTTSFNNPTNNY